jgi:hypothetical protein
MCRVSLLLQMIEFPSGPAVDGIVRRVAIVPKTTAQGEEVNLVYAKIPRWVARRLFDPVSRET